MPLHIKSQAREIDLQQLIAEYRGDVSGAPGCGTYGEGHEIAAYAPLLEYCREWSGDIQLHGGFLPREHARAFMRAPTSAEEAEKAAAAAAAVAATAEVEADGSSGSGGGGDDGAEEGVGGDGPACLRTTTLRSSNSSNNSGNSASELAADVLARLHASGYIGFAEEEGLTTAQSDDEHYSFFESLITGRDPFDSVAGPMARFRKIFRAQLLKDASMAHFVGELLAAEERLTAAWKDTGGATTPGSEVEKVAIPAPPGQRYLVVAGRGHMQHGFGVPERIFARHPELSEEAKSLLVVAAKGSDYGLDTHRDGHEALVAGVNRVFVGEEQQRQPEKEECDGKAVLRGRPLPPAADVVFLYDDQEKATNRTGAAGVADAMDSADADAVAAAVKQETADAYNRVGASAHLEGNLARAHAVMRFLDYDDELIARAGTDAYNYQGVGNPHTLAAIAPGESVLDVGCGLGVDSLLAAHAAGAGGSVTGIDIARREVEHARTRAAARGVADRVAFKVADMEALPAGWSSTFDVVISNGAFCLAPDKEAAFAEVFRVLAPGGRMAIATSTIRGDVLPRGVEWPVCMRMFVPLEEIAPLCERLGFVNVRVDTSHTEMTFEVEEEEELAKLDEGATNPARHRVHVGSPEFNHLQGLDMNELCARVVVYAEKPAAAEVG